MQMHHFKLALLGSLLTALAACGGGSAAVRGIESLGTTFQQAFAQGPNDAPIDVSNADLTVQLNMDPFAL